MPRQECFTVYKFNELSAAGKEKARDWYRRAGAFDEFGVECVIEDFVEQAALCGWAVDEIKSGTSRDGKKQFYRPAVFYSGFSCQGDGACFEGRWRPRDVDVEKLKANCGNDRELVRIATGFSVFASWHPNAMAGVKHRGHYFHERSTEFDFEADSEDCEKAFERGEEEDFTELTRDLMCWLYRQLEAEYEYRNSDAYVDEEIDMNEYEFGVDGSRTVAL